ncbi:MAG TPA: Spo0B domain-containing protein [Bacilli bacterium]|nr:Spo0B domain-containing protein [Bacilli bacterium]
MNEHLPSDDRKTATVRDLMEESLEVLRIYRHDLMNQVQLLQAYSQMKKYDRLQEPIAALVAEAQRHTEWSAFPSSVISYVVLSRDIRYGMMLKLHASYEQVAEPTAEAELLAAQVLSALLDTMGQSAQTRLVPEPVSVDVWIVSFGEGYEIGWFLGGDGQPLAIDWPAWAATWREQGVEMTTETVEDGTEYKLRL